MEFPWKLKRRIRRQYCAGCPLPGHCGIKRCLAQQLSCNPHDLTELLRETGPAFVALQNQRATLGARIDFGQTEPGSVSLLDGGQLLIDFDRLLSVCKLVTVSADLPLLEFDCGLNAERFLIHLESARSRSAVRDFLGQIEVSEEYVEISKAVRWLDDLPGEPQRPVEGADEQGPDGGDCPPFPEGSRLCLRIVTAFAEWKKNFRISSIDFIGNLMVLRDRDCVSYCPRNLGAGDRLFSVRALGR